MKTENNYYTPNIISSYDLSYITEEGHEGDFIKEFPNLKDAIGIAKKTSKEGDTPIEIIKYTFDANNEVNEEYWKEPIIVWDNYNEFVNKYPDRHEY